ISVILDEAGQWGGPQPDGTVTGMVGKVHRHEANFAIDEITITDGRETVVDFTRPYYIDATTLISQAPKEKNRATAVFLPFTPLVWVALLISTLLIGPILVALNKIWSIVTGNNYGEKLHEVSFNMFRSLVIQGNQLPAQQGVERSILCAWYFFCFIIYALFSGTLTAVFAIPAYEKPINSLWDLLGAMKEDGFQPLIFVDTSIERLFKESNSGIYQDIWNLYDPSIGDIRSIDTAFTKILQGKVSFVMGKVSGEILANLRGRNHYHIGKETFYWSGLGIALAEGCPYKENIEQV
ncbi:unnamed protein product, partial [Meganyctiphanes norvegica]